MRVFVGSVRVFKISCLRQGTEIGQAWLSIQVYIHWTGSSGKLDVSQLGQFCIVTSIKINSVLAADYPFHGRLAG